MDENGRTVLYTCGREDACSLASVCKEIGERKVVVPTMMEFSYHIDYLNTVKPLINCKIGYRRWRATKEIKDSK